MWEKLLESTTSPRTYTRKAFIFSIHNTHSSVIYQNNFRIYMRYDIFCSNHGTLWIWQIRVGLNFDLHIIAVGQRWHWSHFSSLWHSLALWSFSTVFKNVAKRYVIKLRGDKIWPEKEPTTWTTIIGTVLEPVALLRRVMGKMKRSAISWTTFNPFKLELRFCGQYS